MFFSSFRFPKIEYVSFLFAYPKKKIIKFREEINILEGLADWKVVSYKVFVECRERELKGMADILEHCWVANIIVFSSSRIVFWSEGIHTKDDNIFRRVHWLFSVKTCLKCTYSPVKSTLRRKILFTCKMWLKQWCEVWKENWVVHQLVEFQGLTPILCGKK